MSRPWISIVRALSSSPGSEVQSQSDNLAVDGWHVSIDVDQQTGADDLPAPELSRQRAVAVMYGEEHPSQGTTPGWCIEHHSR